MAEGSKLSVGRCLVPHISSPETRIIYWPPYPS